MREVTVDTAQDLMRFFDDCMENRSTSSTKLNDRCGGGGWPGVRFRAARGSG